MSSRPSRRAPRTYTVIHYVNLNTSVHGVNLIYSTPSIYTDAKLA